MNHFYILECALRERRIRRFPSKVNYTETWGQHLTFFCLIRKRLCPETSHLYIDILGENKWHKVWKAQQIYLRKLILEQKHMLCSDWYPEVWSINDQHISCHKDKTQIKMPLPLISTQKNLYAKISIHDKMYFKISKLVIESIRHLFTLGDNLSIFNC